MSESDTFLDDILDGVTTVPQPGPASVPPPEPEAPRLASPLPDTDRPKPQITSKLSGIDELLEGLTPPGQPNVNKAAQPANTIDGQPKIDDPEHDAPESNVPESNVPESKVPESNVKASAVTEPDLRTQATQTGESAVRPRDLPVAAPHEILGLPGEPEVSESHFDLAHEVNDVSATQSASGTRSSHSFAAIAQEIAATVDENDPRSRSATTSAEDEREVDRSSLYLRTSRRRRRRRVNRMAFGQVTALVLLLVLGLAGEWEYVSRGQGSTTSTPAVTLPVVPIVRLPKVTSTRVAGTFFQFESSGSAQSSPFRMTRPFVVAWTARCSELPKASSVQVLFDSSGRTALNIFVGMVSHSARAGMSATLRPGVYVAVAHSPGACIWRAQGVARP
jgi:hypothetical protein